MWGIPSAMAAMFCEVETSRTEPASALRNVAPSLLARSRSHLLVHPSYRPSYRHPAVPTCSLGKPGPIIGSAATGAARSAVGGSFQTCLAEHRARATGVSLYHRPDESLFNNSATRASEDQYVHLLEASACQRVRIKVVRVVSETLLRDQDSKA